MHRRGFLTKNGKAALAFGLLPFTGCVSGGRPSGGSNDSLPDASSSRDLEDPIWALGWEIYHGPTGDHILHGGNQTGFHAFTAASMEHELGVVIMTNGDNGWRLNTRVVEHVMERCRVGQLLESNRQQVT